MKDKIYCVYYSYTWSESLNEFISSFRHFNKIIKEQQVTLLQ